QPVEPSSIRFSVRGEYWNAFHIFADYNYSGAGAPDSVRLNLPALIKASSLKRTGRGSSTIPVPFLLREPKFQETPKVCNPNENGRRSAPMTHSLIIDSMRRLNVHVLVSGFLLLASATAQAQRDRDTYNPNNQVFEVFGLVTSAETKKPLAEVSVRLERFA